MSELKYTEEDLTRASLAGAKAATDGFGHKLMDYAETVPVGDAPPLLISLVKSTLASIEWYDAALGADDE